MAVALVTGGTDHIQPIAGMVAVTADDRAVWHCLNQVLVRTCAAAEVESAVGGLHPVFALFRHAEALRTIDLHGGGRLFNWLFLRFLLGGRLHRTGFQQILHVRPEGVHGLSVLGEPVHHIGVVGGDALLVPLAVADDVLLSQAELPAQVGTQLHRLLIDGGEINRVFQAVLADFKADVGAVGRAASVPAEMIPREGLVCSDGAVCQLADERVDAHLPAHWLVPVVAIPVLPQQAVIRGDVAVQPGVVRAGAVNHDALRLHLPAGFVTGVFSENEFVQIHVYTSVFSLVLPPAARR